MKARHTLLRLGTLLLALALVVEVVYAGPQPSEREVVVGALHNWPPHYVDTDDGTPGGFAVDVMNEVAARAGVRVRYVQFERFPEMRAALAEGRIDVIPNYGIVAERRAHAGFTPPVETFSIGVFVRSDSAELSSVADLAGRQVAAVEFNAAIGLLAERGVDAVIYPDVPSALFDLLAGHVDAFAYPSSVLWARARQSGVADHLREIGPPLAEIKRAIAVRTDRVELLARLSAAVEDFVGTPAYQAIYRRWHGHPAPFWTVRKISWAAGIVLVALLVLAVLWRYRVVTRHNRELLARIAERDAAEAALVASEAKYRQIVETASEGVWVIDAAGDTTFVNRRMAEILDLTPDDMLGRPFFDFFDAELAGEARERLQRRLEGHAEVHDFQLRRADGTAVSVVMAASPIFEDGEFRGALAMVADVTDRRRLEEGLRQSQRLEALGRLAGGIAHDFNNLLLTITATVEMARRSLLCGGRIHRDLDDIDAAASRAGALISQLLAFSRRQVMRPRVLRPADSIAEASPLLRRLLGDQIELELSVSGASGAVRIDPSQLDQLVFNLASNARDAMPDGGRLAIGVEDRTLGAGGAAEPGNYVVVSVSDSGCGIAADVLAHLFDPFFTTKPEGEGTGLGLATCYGIVAQAGGHIEVDSEPGAGARFAVFLPRVAPPADRAAPLAEPARAAQRSGATILLVEDEPTVRRLVLRILDDGDNVVHCAGNARDALRLCREHASELDVLLTDVRMPEMNGRELARASRALAPQLWVVYMSGDTGQVLDDLSELDERERFLPKPFTREQLLAAVVTASAL